MFYTIYAQTIWGSAEKRLKKIDSIDSAVRGYNTYSDSEVELDCSQITL